jgi:integrase
VAEKQHTVSAIWASRARPTYRLPKVTAAAGLDPADWTPRELRHSFVSLMSDAGVPIERISRLVGHSGTTVTETVYRKQIRPVITYGAEAMDRIFPARESSDDASGGGADDTPDEA